MKINNRIILASASPRRKELLEQIGLIFEVIPSQADENIEESDPVQFVKALSERKASDLSDRAEADDIIIGADTIVVLNGTVMGKPADKAEAFQMLSRLQGNTHHVYTGVTLIKGTTQISFAQMTDVTMYPMTEQEIRDYIATGEPMDKAGAYGIQGRSAAFIKEICGDYNNVVGLPAGRVYQELKRLSE